MARLKLSATRSNLLMTKQRLKLAREGYQLLDKKRDVLIMEILRMIEDAERVQKQVEEKFVHAYASLQEARAAIGTERVQRIALSRPQEVDVRITPHSIMGVVVPSVTYQVPERHLTYGFGDTSVVLDEAQRDWGAVLVLMGQLSETVATVWRLAFELRRTQRRVNALEQIFIPSYEETLTYIQETLEEKDREELFRMKRSKTKITRQQA
jgi:V/A-type H+/Na+-transporting ATPase subunit D